MRKMPRISNEHELINGFNFLAKLARGSVHRMAKKRGFNDFNRFQLIPTILQAKK